MMHLACRWRTRDIEGNLFRQAKSSAKPEAGPPRDAVGTERYTKHLPFQVFCCESGSHVVDPEQSYYRNIEYRASLVAQNLSSADIPPEWDPEVQCMDSTQMWFCRDLWTDAARGGIKGTKSGHRKGEGGPHKKRGLRPLAGDHAHGSDEPQKAPEPKQVKVEKRQEQQQQQEQQKEQAAAGGKADFGRRQIKDDKEQDSGTDNDAMAESEEENAPAPIDAADQLESSALLIPNSGFTPARILVNPRCLTTYGGVSHTQLALDLFGTSGGDETMGRYALEDWAGPPDSFVCQEMRTTGGRTAPKSQRRVGWLLQNEVSFHECWLSHYQPRVDLVFNYRICRSNVESAS